MARNLTGSPDKIDIGGANDFDPTAYTDFSIGCWFLVDTFDVTWQTLFSKGAGSWRLSREENTNNLRTSRGLFPNESKVLPTYDVNDGVYHQAVMNWTNSTTKLELFIDGVSRGSDTTQDSDVENDTDPAIGENINNGNRGFKGDLCEFFFFDKVLTANQILGLFHGAPIMTMKSANMLAYYPVWGDLSPEPEWSNSGITGTVTGTTKSAHAPVELLENYL